MSDERGDATYKPTKSYKERAEQRRPPGRPVRTSRKETDYTETLLISDTEEEETQGAVEIESVGLDIKLETLRLDTESLRSECWSPRTFSEKTDNHCRQIAEYKQQTKMAKQPEANIASVL